MRPAGEPKAMTTVELLRDAASLFDTLRKPTGLRLGEAVAAALRARADRLEAAIREYEKVEATLVATGQNRLADMASARIAGYAQINAPDSTPGAPGGPAR